MILAALLTSAVSFAQPGMSEGITWNTSVQEKGDGTYTIIFSGDVPSGHYTYTLKDEYSATAINDLAVKGGELIGEVYETGTPTVEEDGSQHYYGKIEIAQDVKVESEGAIVSGSIFSNICTDMTCSAQYWDFEVNVGGAASTSETAAVETEDKEGKSLWLLIIEAILWGFAMLLTPCVFPMVPMTVSFFMKGSESVAAGRFKAAMYGLFIILLYTVPISVIIILTRVIGGDAVTADIFNWLSTHWIPNIIFFVIFMIFAASFFGAFEIKMPQSLVNKSDQGADKKGLAGVFFMALTLVLVSFSCTGPIVGTVLIESTQGKFWAPMVTMLAFSGAFALPFTVLALFPSLLTKFKRSGGSWLNSVKVVLGFVEIALGLKFLSVADQTYHWGLLDREIYLGIWIVVFTLLGFYLLGKLKFAHDSEVKYISVPRLALAIASFTFVTYMVPGLWGAPLKKMTGYLPPMATQDFVLTSGGTAAVAPADQVLTVDGKAPKYSDVLHMPHGLSGFYDYEEALAAARKANKPVFLDFTGLGCVNCREMEERVWCDSRILESMREDFVLLALFGDSRAAVAEEDQVTTANGKVLKTIGEINANLAYERYGIASQPNYLILDGEGNVLASHSYDLNIDNFIAFLEEGKQAYDSLK